MALSRCLGEPDGKRGVHGVKSKATEKALQSTLLLPIPEIPYRYPHGTLSLLPPSAASDLPDITALAHTHTPTTKLCLHTQRERHRVGSGQ